MPIRSQARVPIRRGAAAQFAGVQPIVLDVPYHRQVKDQWCWAACCQMLLGFFQREDVRQCAMACAQFGGECCSKPFPSHCNQGCFPEDAYGRYHVSVGGRVPRNRQADLDEELEAGRPVEVYYVWVNEHGEDDGAHVALVTARNADGTYEVHDPWFGSGPRSPRRIRNGYGKGRWDSSYVGIALEEGA